jgi:dTDP-glucose 4,6-dehydratase
VTDHVIVYGAAGFVASTLISSRLLPGSRLTLIDQEPIDPETVRAAQATGRSVDVLRSSGLSGASDPGEADVLLVLAGQTDVDQALANPALAFTANGAIAVEVGEWWRRHPSARVVYMSSDEVLGVSDHPLTEDAPYAPTQPYAASKAAAEMTLRCYAETYAGNLVIVRSCNLIGGRQRARKLIPTAVERLARSAPVPIFGSGEQVREYLAVEDLCEVLRSAVEGELSAGTYNCSSGIALSILEVVDIVAAALAVPADVVHVADRMVHDRRYAMDASLLHSFGWKAHTSPEEAAGRAARELLAAWQRGERLTEPRGGVG